MDLSPLLLPGGILLSGLSLTLLGLHWRRRRHGEHLARLARKYELARATGPPSREVLRLASPLDDPRGKVELDEVLVGRDSDGGWYAASRRAEGRRRQTLFFPLGAGPRLTGFRFAPEEKPRRRGAGKERFALRWCAGREQWLDEASLGLAARVLHHTARILEEGGGSVAQVEIDGGRILLLAAGPLRGRKLESFLADASRLRRLLLQALRRTRQVSESVQASGPQKPARGRPAEPVTLLRR